MLPVFPKRMSLWIGAVAALAAGCASPPGGLGLHAPAARPAAEVLPAASQRAARAPPGDPGGLESVSCARPAACMAVGLSFGRKPGQFRPLAEAWNGTAWRVLKVFGELDDVACAAVSRCLAVGTATRGRTPTGLAESWNGATWQRLRIRFVRGTADSGLNGVSCRRRACMIVGAYQRRLRGQALPLAMQLRGTRLRMLRPRLPQGRKSAELAGVSCASASACMAVGSYFIPSAVRGPHSHTLAEAWNGAGWRVIRTPTPDRAPDSELGFVSCAAAARCLATGSFDFLTAASSRPLTEAWQAGRWHVLRISGPRIPGFFPLGVSCGSASSCIVVGSIDVGYGRPAAERWNGRTLRALPVPRPRSGNLNGISCATPRRCIAVGNYHTAGTEYPAAERWNGKNWRVLPAQP